SAPPDPKAQSEKEKGGADRSPRTPELHRSPRKRKKKSATSGGSRSAAPAGRSARRPGGAARSVGRRSSLARHPPRARVADKRGERGGEREQGRCCVDRGA